MNTVFEEGVIRNRVFHRDYNLDKKDNIDLFPEIPAVFGIFCLIRQFPVHPRHVGSTDNLRRSVRRLFEHPGSRGLKTYMQGPWLKMLCYLEMPDSSPEDRLKKEQEWIRRYTPGVTGNGQYPGPPVSLPEKGPSITDPLPDTSGKKTLFTGTIQNAFPRQSGVQISVLGLNHPGPVLLPMEPTEALRKTVTGDTLEFLLRPSSGGVQKSRRVLLEVKQGQGVVNKIRDDWEVQVKAGSAFVECFFSITVQPAEKT